ncbi:hypothetical protein KSP40_PGU005020 [Platanthera guangdongensis]|uniref:Uncharacterized protein n=1 Tax=Platanthera guangdongensis TaxID=2320717 RepID=A0ABR2MFK3_9ASPA
METRLHLRPPQPEKTDDPLPPSLPTGKRIKRRARDVSSRYMVAVSPRSAPSSPIHPSSTPSSFRNNHRRHSPKTRIPSLPSSPDVSDSESEHSSQFADENQRSFDTPVPLGMFCKAPNTVKRHVVRLFSDNTSDVPLAQIVQGDKRPTDSRFSPYRPGIGTPMPAISSKNQLRSTCKSAMRERKPKAMALSPFPLSYGSVSGNHPSLDVSGTEICSISSPDGLCNSPPIRAHGSCRKKALQLRSSMPEADSLPINSRRRAEPKKLVFRNSLNSTSSSFQPTPLDLMKEVNNKTSIDVGRTFLPAHLPSHKLGFDQKKGKMGSIRRGDAHVLHLLHNQYLQWKFVNAKEKVASEARVINAERSLYNVSVKLKKLRDSVIEKRMELERLNRLRSLSSIVDLEMPHLEEWALADEEYSTSLSGTIKALKDALTRLPVIGDVRLDVRELKVAIHSVNRMFESLSPSIERYLPMVDGVEKVSTELAKVATKEKALVEECGGLLSQVQELQVKECSLRGMLIQVKRSSIN